ncbi:MAG: DUF1579 domain-containing protein [Chthoniobacterales bacterium]
MNIRQPDQPTSWRKRLLFSIVLLAITLPLRAQEPSTSPSVAPSPSGPASTSTITSSSSSTVATSPIAAPAGQPNEAEMMNQMMELAKLNENHKLLAELDGTWDYNVTMWMAPSAPPMKSSGTAVRKSMMGGRYFVMDATGKMKMPGADGKLKDFEFKGHGIEGYDNVKKKFVGTWIDNMGTGIMMSEGDYDPASKSFTYNSEMEPMPGMKTKVREVVKLADKNHMSFEWYEDRGGQEMKTMQIDYTRKK